MSGTAPTHTPIDRMDLLAVGPLPHRRDGRPTFQFGGSIYDASLFTGLAGLGHRIQVLATYTLDTTRFEPNDFGPGVSVEWFAVQAMGTPPSPEDVRSRRAEFESALDRAIEKRQPDLVLFGNESQGLYCVDACIERGLPMLLVAHGYPALTSGYYSPELLESLMHNLGRVDLIVTVAPQTEAVMRGLGLTRIRTVLTGVDTDLFSPRTRDPSLLSANRIDPARFVVGSFSPLRPGKRLPDVVASAEIVLRAKPETLYLVAGDGPDGERVRELIARTGLGESFRVVGELDHADVPAHMALCDVVVHASESETFGLVVREAQAAGRAVVVSDIPAMHELVDDGETGVYFPVGDVEAIAARTLELTRDSELRSSLAANARAVAVEKSGAKWLRGMSKAMIDTARAR